MVTAHSTSVIIPVYNGERYLAEAIHSALAQTRPPAEVLVVDDGSTDGSVAIARSFGPAVRVLAQANLGPAAARNLGVTHASGDLLAFIDADDLWLPDKLARQEQVLWDDPGCEAVLGSVQNFISPELDAAQRQALARSTGRTGTHLIGALLIRQKSFHRIGAFDSRRRHGEFIEWWGRALRLGLRHTVLPELVLRRRLHADNLMRRDHTGHEEYLSILREQIAQRRTLAGQRPAQHRTPKPSAEQNPGD